MHTPDHLPQPEIMAPAGSFESLSAAIGAGADSVYLGVAQLNMRARSSNNFSISDIGRVAETCRANNVRSYITLNTILYDHDIGLMQSILGASKEAGISAVIAADHAVMAHAKKLGVPVHISTQANISNFETVAFYAAYADVMVLSRELSLAQVGAITRQIKRTGLTGPSGHPVRTEVFVHGALCMAVSGKCYMSLHSHFASANRGACMQNCRREYVVTDREDGIELAIDNAYIMSAKDLCTIDFLDKILAAGVSVLKIEGRGRPADYVHVTTQCYREAVEAIHQGTYTPERIETWKTRLATVYNRGFWDGYYLGRTLGEWSHTYGSQATERKLFLGKGVKYYGRIGVGEFVMETHSLRQGDELLITGVKTGVIRTVATELRVDNIPVEKVSKGMRFTMPLSQPMHAADKLYRIIPTV